MSIISFAPDIAREGEVVSERKNALVELLNRKYTRHFVVVTSDLNDGPLTILTSYFCPKIGDPYLYGNDSDPLATCVSVTPRATASPWIWKVEAKYDTERLTQAALTNPLNIPPELRWSNTRYERVLTRDVQGVPIVNSSKEAFDPPLQVEDSRPVLTITRNEAAYNPANEVLYQDAINADIFAGTAPGNAKLNILSADRQVDIGLLYWRIVYEIEFRRESFALFVLDQGFRGIDKHLFRDVVDNAPLSNPTLLNGRGARRDGVSTTLTVACALGDNQLFLTDASAFPPGPGNPIGSNPPFWYFEVKIDNEVMQVQALPFANQFSVVRGYAGTTPAAHLINATVTLEPHYLRFVPYKILPFAPLLLPVV